MRFLAATNNRGKLREIREILEEYGHECLSMAEAGIHSDPEETGETLEQNAVIKARAAAALTTGSTLARVTIPAPVRNAPSAASSAAPR